MLLLQQLAILTLTNTTISFHTSPKIVLLLLLSIFYI